MNDLSGLHNSILAHLAFQILGRHIKKEVSNINCLLWRRRAPETSSSRVPSLSTIHLRSWFRRGFDAGCSCNFRLLCGFICVCWGSLFSCSFGALRNFIYGCLRRLFRGSFGSRLDCPGIRLVRRRWDILLLSLFLCRFLLSLLLGGFLLRLLRSGFLLNRVTVPSPLKRKPGRRAGQSQRRRSNSGNRSWLRKKGY